MGSRPRPYMSSGISLRFVCFTALSGVAIQGIEQNDTPWTGALERVSAYAVMVWLVVLAWVTPRPYRAESCWLRSAKQQEAQRVQRTFKITIAL